MGALCPHAEIKDKSLRQLLRMLTLAAYSENVISRNLEGLQQKPISVFFLINTEQIDWG